MKDKIKNLELSSKKKYMLAFIIPLLLNVFVFGVLNFYPFGEDIYIRSDAYHQYIRFLEFLKRVVYEGDFSEIFYSFSNGFGQGGALYVAYYLLSPFNILVILLPFLNIEMVFMLMMILKVSILGLAFYYFLEKFDFEIGKGKYIFSTAYSFISFVTMYSMNIMWLDSLILCPIILVQLKEMFETKKVFKFTILMFILYVSNFYMAFMICLFLVILLICSVIFDKESRVELKEKIKLFSISIGISVLLFGFVMMPVLCELKEFYLNSNLNLGTNTLSIAEILAKFFVFSYDTFFSIRYSIQMAPYIYFGLFPFILSLVYLLFDKIDVKKKILITTSVIIFCSFIFNELNVVWHGFDAPTGFNYRYSFLLSFIGLIMACEGFKYISQKDLSRKEMMILSITLLILLLITVNKANVIMIIINLFLILLYLSILFLSKSINLWKHKIVMVFALEIILNAVALNLMMSAQIGVPNKQEYFEGKSKDVIEQVVEKYADDNYRMLIERNILPSVNTPMETGYNGVSTFNSSISFGFLDILECLGGYKYGDLMYSLDSNYITDSIFSIKYVISEKELTLYRKLEKLIIGGKKAYLYENPYALPIGFVTKNNIKNIKTRNIEENILNIVSSVTGKDYVYEKLYDEYLPIKVTIDGKEIKPDKNGDYILKRKGLKKRSILKIKYPKNLDLVVRVNKENINNSSWLLIAKKGETFDECYRNRWSYYNQINEKNGVLEFYTYSEEWKNDELEEMNLGDLKALELNEDYMKGILEDISSAQCVDVTYRNNGHLKMSVNIESEEELLFTSIPYANSWKAKVNGEEVNLINLETNTLGLKLEKGLNEIEFIYIPNGLGIGIFMTLLGIVFLLFRIKKFE